MSPAVDGTLSAGSGTVRVMRETPAELDALQVLLDASFASASEHLRSIMEPHRRLTAQRLSTELPSPAVLNIATVTARGEPRVSAVDGHFLHGHWYFSTSGQSPKSRQLVARPAISAAFTPRDGYGVFCHGTAALLPPGHPERDALVAHWVEVYGMELDAMGPDITCFRIDPHWLVGFAFGDEEMAAIEAERAARQAGSA